jgi:hypothetical protein
MIKGELKIFLSALASLVFVIFSFWAFDYGLGMMNQRSDLRLVLGILLVVGLIFLWVGVAQKLWKEGKKVYDAAKNAKKTRVDAVQPGPATESDKKG